MRRPAAAPLNLLLFALPTIVLESSWLHLLVPLDNRLLDRFVFK